MSSDFSDSEKVNRATPIGQRLLRAFYDAHGITDKKEIATRLGFQSEKAVYKVVNGEQEMKFETLRRFREETGHTIDWLLGGADGIDKDQLISVRVLLKYGPWLSAVEERRIEESKQRGTTIFFEDFMAEMVKAGFNASGLYAMIRDIVKTEIRASRKRLVHEIELKSEQETRDKKAG